MKKLTIPQARRIAIRRLEATLKKINSIHYSQFNYGSFVEKGNDKTVCGTVCCVAGWYPKWFPKAKLEWYRVKREVGTTFKTRVCLRRKNASPDSVDRALSKYHLLDVDIIKSLFFGGSFVKYFGRYIGPLSDMGSSKKEVSDYFKKVIRHLKKGDLDNHLILKK